MYLITRIVNHSLHRNPGSLYFDLNELMMFNCAMNIEFDSVRILRAWLTSVSVILDHIEGYKLYMLHTPIHCTPVYLFILTYLII